MFVGAIAVSPVEVFFHGIHWTGAKGGKRRLKGSASGRAKGILQSARRRIGTRGDAVLGVCSSGLAALKLYIMETSQSDWQLQIH